MENKEVRERYWWKNTESQQILNRGYLLQGESVEGAIDSPCKRYPLFNIC